MARAVLPAQHALSRPQAAHAQGKHSTPPNHSRSTNSQHQQHQHQHLLQVTPLHHPLNVLTLTAGMVRMWRGQGLRLRRRLVWLRPLPGRQPWHRSVQQLAEMVLDPLVLVPLMLEPLLVPAHQVQHQLRRVS